MRPGRENLHAVGLLVDILEAIEKRVRGKAGRPEIKVKLVGALAHRVGDFVEEVNHIVDGVVDGVNYDPSLVEEKLKEWLGEAGLGTGSEASNPQMMGGGGDEKED